VSKIPPAGSIGLVRIKGLVGQAIRVGQFLDGDGFRDFEHAFVLYQRGSSAELCTVVEAEPRGARLAGLDEYKGRQVLWLSCPEQYAASMLAAAVTYVGVPYSFTDYVTVAAHHLHLPVSKLLEYVVEHSHHVVCSQLVVACADKAGWPLLPEHDWPGFVTPGRLAQLAAADAEPTLVE